MFCGHCNKNNVGEKIRVLDGADMLSAGRLMLVEVKTYHCRDCGSERLEVNAVDHQKRLVSRMVSQFFSQDD